MLSSKLRRIGGRWYGRSEQESRGSFYKDVQVEEASSGACSWRMQIIGTHWHTPQPLEAVVVVGSVPGKWKQASSDGCTTNIHADLWGQEGRWERIARISWDTLRMRASSWSWSRTGRQKDDRMQDSRNPNEVGKGSTRRDSSSHSNAYLRHTWSGLTGTHTPGTSRNGLASLLSWLHSTKISFSMPINFSDRSNSFPFYRTAVILAYLSPFVTISHKSLSSDLRTFFLTTLFYDQQRALSRRCILSHWNYKSKENLFHASGMRYFAKIGAMKTFAKSSWGVPITRFTFTTAFHHSSLDLDNSQVSIVCSLSWR